MSVETLGKASDEGWRVTARCAWGKRDGMKSRHECLHREELDLATLVWTRGRAFPLSSQETRLRCPRCGSRRISIFYDVPTMPIARRATDR